MTSDDTTEFRLTLSALAATFRVEADVALFTGYWMGCEDLELGAFKRACGAAIRQCKFMPTVAELRELAGVPKSGDIAEQAADVADQARAFVGAYRSPRFQDAIINAVIRSMGGWTAFCDTPDEQWIAFDRKKFVEHYKRIVNTGASKEAIASLGGLHSISNSGRGVSGPDDESVLVGCEYLDRLPANAPQLRIAN